MKLTKQQRIECYQYAIRQVQRGFPYMCHLVIDFINDKNILGEPVLYGTKQFLFPELYMFEQILTGSKCCWFTKWENVQASTKEARLFILGSCILMAEEAEE